MLCDMMWSDFQVALQLLRTLILIGSIKKLLLCLTIKLLRSLEKSPSNWQGSSKQLWGVPCFHGCDRIPTSTSLVRKCSLFSTLLYQNVAYFCIKCYDLLQYDWKDGYCYFISPIQYSLRSFKFSSKCLVFQYCASLWTQCSNIPGMVSLVL